MGEWIKARPLWVRLLFVIVAVVAVVAAAKGAVELAGWLLGGAGVAEATRAKLGARRDANAAADRHSAATSARNDDRAADQAAADRDVVAAELDDTLDDVPPVNDDDRAERSFGSPWD